MTFATDFEALNYLIINGCVEYKGTIYPPQDNFEAWNSNKLNWDAVNYLLQMDYKFERFTH